MTLPPGYPSLHGNKNGLVNLAPSDSCGVGFVASIGDVPSQEILQLGLTSLANLQHRGATSVDGISGDGAGVTTSLPRKLICKWLQEIGSTDTKYGKTPNEKSTELVGVGVLFFPSDVDLRAHAESLVVEQIKSLGLRPIGFRDVPVDPASVGPAALANMPRIVQVFVDCHHSDADRFERELFLVRRGIELTPKTTGLESLYVASLSCRTICYKGMVVASKLQTFFVDLKDADFECSFCIFHQRLTTNTSPEWSQCQPFRRLAHNGEISTMRGNRNRMSVRESSFQHPLWQEYRGTVRRLFSSIDSDSASLDNILELLSLTDRSILHSIAMLIPSAWENDPRVADEQKAFFEFHGCFCEPWDGPAAIALTDGKTIAACLDRNGLRPARYKITNDGILLVGSEAGADRIEDSRVIAKGRLAPGEMIAVDLKAGKLLRNDAIKNRLARQSPYRDWLNENSFEFHPRRDVETDEFENAASPEFLRRQIAAGLTAEEADDEIRAMAIDGKESKSSGNSAASLAVLNDGPIPLTGYFKQRLAQVMYPSIDSIQERKGMSLATGLGPERNILTESSNHCRVLNIDNPILLPDDLSQLGVQSPFKVQKIDCTWDRNAGAAGLRTAIFSVVQAAQLAIEQDATILILSDRAVSAQRVAIPMMLAVGAVHHGLCQTGQRMMCSIVVETADVRDSHQLALMFGYGASAVCPYLAYETIARLHSEEKLSGQLSDSFRRYKSALSDGLLKVLARAGISMLNSFKSAQIFEAIGLAPEVMSTCFRNSFAVLGSVGFSDLAADSITLHDAAFLPADEELNLLSSSCLTNTDDGTGDSGGVCDLFQIVNKVSNDFDSGKVESVPDILKRFSTTQILERSRDSKRVGFDRLDGFVTRYGLENKTGGTGLSDRRISLVCPVQRHDAYSIEDMAQLSNELKVVDPESEVCIELVAQTGVGGIAVGLAKVNVESILVGGCQGDGLCDSNLRNRNGNVGLPWEIGVAEIHQSLVAGLLRNQVVLKAGVGTSNANEIVRAAILGAEEFVLNLEGDQEQQESRLQEIASDCRKLLAQIGVASIDEIVGRTELLEIADESRALLEGSALLHRPSETFKHRTTESKIIGRNSKRTAFDDRFVDEFLERNQREFDFDVVNTDCNIGTRIAGVVAEQNGRSGWDGVSMVELRLRGSAGQSLAAYLCDGVRISLTGEANDYVGKRMSGGEIVVRSESQFEANENLVAGNAVLYGATSGHLFVAGQVAERFCVRNGGATAVIQGCGDHGCERMTDGTIVVLGPVGNNFGAGMTGGRAFVWDPNQEIELSLNRQSVTTSALSPSDCDEVKRLIDAFHAKTQSEFAQRLLANWEHSLLSFRKVCSKRSKFNHKPAAHFNLRKKDSTLLPS